MTDHVRVANYVAGFLFSFDRRRVLLIQKNRPRWQAGKLNGVGGKIEAGETPLDAMRREFREEAGIDGLTWEEFATLGGPDFKVHFFAAFGDQISTARQTTDECLIVARVTTIQTLAVIPNLRVLIPLALDESGIVKPVHLADERPSG